MSTADLRDRAERIRERAAPLATQPRAQTLYAPGTALGWVILRVCILDEENPDNNELWAQPIGYIDGVFLEGNTEITDASWFIEVKPPPCVQFACFEAAVRPLLHRTTAAAITTNPDPVADGDQYEQNVADFAAAVAEENLGSNAYPLLLMEWQGELVVFPPFWANRNVTFDDVTRQMHEGSGS